MVPKLQGLVSRCKTLLPGEKSRPLVKGWGVGCFTTRLLSPQFTSCCHGAASFGNGMPYSGGSWCACVCPSPQNLGRQARARCQSPTPCPLKFEHCDGATVCNFHKGRKVHTVQIRQRLDPTMAFGLRRNSKFCDLFSIWHHTFKPEKYRSQIWVSNP